MITPSQQFFQFKKELETLNNNHAMQLRQELNRFESEIKQRLNDLDILIQEKVQLELNTHLPIIHDAVTRIHQKVEKHFGP